jgi:hypothetical protein
VDAGPARAVRGVREPARRRRQCVVF